MAGAISSMAENTQAPSDEALSLETVSGSCLLSPSSSQALDSTSVISHTPTSKDTSTQNTSTSPVEETLARLSIDDVNPRTMFWSLYSVFQDAHRQDGSIDLDHTGMELLKARLHRAEWLDDLHGVRIGEDLVACREVMEQMLQSGSKFLSDAVHILLEASRHRQTLPDWHYAFGHAGIVSFLLQVVATDTASDILLDFTIRTIGNTCIENDLNRQIVVDNNGLKGIIQQLDNPSIKAIIAPVLHNICDDSEPAQKLALANGVYPKLVELLLESLTASTPYFGYLCRLLELLTESYDTETSSDGTMEILFQATIEHTIEFDDFCALFNVIIAHLQAKRNQRYLIDQDMVQLALSLLHESYSQTLHNSSSASLPTEEEKELKSMREGLVTVLADISCLPEFATKYGSLDSSVANTLVRWLRSQHTELQTCSCIMLGNIAQSESTCRLMVHQHLYMILFNLIKTSSHTSVLFAALGFLGNLASLAEAKGPMRQMGIIPEMARFWKAGPLALVSIKLTWRVMKGSMDNVSRLLAPLSGGEEGPVNELEGAYGHASNLAATGMPSFAEFNDPVKTHLSLLLSAFEQFDNSELKLEVGYLVHTMLWTIHSSAAAISPGSKEALLMAMYRRHPNIAKPLGLMVQNGNPEIRSKGWFAMALMARTIEGAVSLEFLLSGETLAALRAAIGGQSTTAEAEPPASGEARLGADQEAEMKMNICRDNATVMVHEILKNGSGITDDRRGEFEELLRHRAHTSTTSPGVDG
ncbi:hypothetical protein MMC30_000512 [Trapelia coarctata]|nr:hypothetical protein [Trapelia coarctata]